MARGSPSHAVLRREAIGLDEWAIDRLEEDPRVAGGRAVRRPEEKLEGAVQGLGGQRDPDPLLAAAPRLDLGQREPPRHDFESRPGVGVGVVPRGELEPEAPVPGRDGPRREGRLVALEEHAGAGDRTARLVLDDAAEPHEIPSRRGGAPDDDLARHRVGRALQLQEVPTREVEEEGGVAPGLDVGPDEVDPSARRHGSPIDPSARSVVVPALVFVTGEAPGSDRRPCEAVGLEADRAERVDDPDRHDDGPLAHGSRIRVGCRVDVRRAVVGPRGAVLARRSVRGVRPRRVVGVGVRGPGRLGRARPSPQEPGARGATGPRRAVGRDPGVARRKTAKAPEEQPRERDDQRQGPPPPHRDPRRTETRILPPNVGARASRRPAGSRCRAPGAGEGHARAERPAIPTGRSAWKAGATGGRSRSSAGHATGPVAARPGPACAGGRGVPRRAEGPRREGLPAAHATEHPVLDRGVLHANDDQVALR